MKIAGTPLTTSETEIVRYLALGFSLNEISAAMDVARRSLDRKRCVVFQKLEVESNARLCVKALALGIVSVDELPVASSHDLSVLSHQQTQLLLELSRGYEPDTIAATLSLSRGDVDTGKDEILHLLGLRTRVQLIHYAVQQGLLSCGDLKATVLGNVVDCLDCGGTGQYVGLHAVEPCRGCGGTGQQ